MSAEGERGCCRPECIDRWVLGLITWSKAMVSLPASWHT